jgi:hypothetical protein
VSTRKLIAVALLCGLAILVAGGVQLFRISDRSQRTVDVLEQDQSATVGDVAVTVEGSGRTASGIAATVQLSAPPSGRASDVDVAGGFRLLIGGRLESPTNTEPASGACPSTVPAAELPLRCEVHFASHDGTATLSFSQGGEQRLWRLDLGSPSPSPEPADGAARVGPLRRMHPGRVVAPEHVAQQIQGEVVMRDDGRRDVGCLLPNEVAAITTPGR